MNQQQSGETNKVIDKRMEWILRLEEFEKATDPTTYCTEYEICSEVRISGVFTYGNGMMMCSLFQEADDRGLFTYILRINHVEKEFEYDENKYSTEGYYFKDGLIGEILAMFSIYFQSRFFLKAVISGEMTATSIRTRFEKNLRYKKMEDISCLDIEMFSDQNRNWCRNNGLNNFLDSIISIDEVYHQNLIRSLHWYTEAIKELGVNHELFFIKMVSSVEALLEFVEVQNDVFSNKLYKLTEADLFDSEEGNEIKNWLTNRKIGKKFVSFLMKYSQGFTEEIPKVATHCYIKEAEIKDYARRIYNARSAYLHTGKPMYLSMDMRADDMQKWDVDPSGGMMVDRKKFSEKEKLPRMRWFERLVNYSLRKFIEEKLAVPKNAIRSNIFDKEIVALKKDGFFGRCRKFKKYLQKDIRASIISFAVFIGAVLFAYFMSVYGEKVSSIGYYVLAVEIVIISLITFLMAGHSVMKILFAVSATGLSLLIFLAQSYCLISPEKRSSVSDAALLSLIGVGVLYIGYGFFRSLYIEVSKRMKQIKDMNPKEKPWLITVPYGLFVGILTWQIGQVVVPIINSLCVYK
jgi:hypothetical protein